MPGREYVCGDCRHRFDTPEGEASNTRALMCQSCGSIDLSIVSVEHAPQVVMRAAEPAKAVERWRKSGVGAS